MAAVKTRAGGKAGELVLGLHGPGMTAVLRAGLGGLAASLHAIGRGGKGWPDHVPLGPGWAQVRPTEIVLHWPEQGPDKVVEALIDKSFQLSREGQVYLPGAYGEALRTRPEVVAALHVGLLRSFLVVPKVVMGRKRVVRSFEVDGQQYSYDTETLEDYVHRTQTAKLARALRTGTVVGLASWAVPGATQRHIQFEATTASYTPAQAVAAVFVMVGCLVYMVGCLVYRYLHQAVLVIPDPADLVAFGSLRSALTPTRYEDGFVAGAGDAILALNAALRMDEARSYGDAVTDASAVVFGRVAWDRKGAVRVGIIPRTRYTSEVLDQYITVASTLPGRLRRRRSSDAASHLSLRGRGRAREARIVARAAGDSFVSMSALRAFVTGNLARGRRWYEGFATATDGGDRPRYVHYYYARENRGALRWEDREGMRVMIDHLDEIERALVRSVHDALRQRFGRIAEETRTNATAMRNRWDAEWERWRLAFAGAKTHEQIRAALADLWSRGGGNPTLRAQWSIVLPLLRRERWRAARDLALVALASYARRDENQPAEGEESAEGPEE